MNPNMARLASILLLVTLLGCDAWEILVFEPEIPPFEPRYRADLVVEGVRDAILAEDGTWSAQVRLSVQPDGSVLIPVNLSDEGEARGSVTSLVFDALTWNVPQVVTLMGVDDRERDGDQPLVLTLGPGSSTQDRFDRVEAVTIELTVQDGVCGNGVLDGAEACEPEAEATSCVYGVERCEEECSTSCQLEVPPSPGFCGDGVVQSGEEECDAPLAPCAYGEEACLACERCKKVSGVVVGYCGDDITQPEGGEACDGGMTSTVSCSSLGLIGGTVTSCDNDCSLDVSPCFRAVDVAVARGRTCALSDVGDLYCWGGNADGALGDGTYASRPLPQRVDGLPRVHSITLGINHVCAVGEDETVFCWGRNTYGQLGNGTQIESNTPVQVSGVSNAVDVAAGWYHTCVLRNTGRVSCWGWNAGGQLLDGTTKDKPRPVDIVGVEQATALVATPFGACALTQNGKVLCWGLLVAAFGVTDVELRELGTFGDVVTLFGDGTMICWRSMSQGVYCIGENTKGQFGNSTLETIAVPTSAPHLNDIASLSAFENHACLSSLAGVVRCSGDNEYGQLGDGSYDASTSLGLPLQNLPPATKVVVSPSHSCALLEDGGVKCWGDNLLGQLGATTASASAVPKPVEGVSSVKDIVAGAASTCVLLFNGTVKCWGVNRAGQLGNGANEASSVPVDVSSLNNVRYLAMGSAHACAIVQGGDVWCWGSNSYGELGERTGDQNRPVQVTGVTNAVSLALGTHHSCAIHQDGAATCWGGNYLGQIRTGLGPFISRAVLVGLPDVASMEAGLYHTCARLRDNSLHCWGDNKMGQVGAGSMMEQLAPVRVQGLMSVQDFATGFSHSCALQTSGGLSCWGVNDYGQLGNNSTEPRNAPVKVPGFLNTSSIALGSYHSCAVTQNGDVYCWGNNHSGQLGDGSLRNQYSPSLVVGLTNVAEVAGGGIHTCARMQDNTVRCWGSNLNGQLGRPFKSSSPTPVPVSFP